MSEEENSASTENATESGAETGNQTDTNDDAQQGQFTQSDLDRAVSQALITAKTKQAEESERQRKIDEQIKAVEESDFKTAFEMQNAEIQVMKADMEAKTFKAEGLEVLNRLGMADQASVLMYPGLNSIEELIQRAEAQKIIQGAAIETGVNSRLNSGTGHVPDNTKTPSTGVPDGTNPEEFIAWRKAKGLVG